MKSLQEAIDAITAKGVRTEGVDAEAQEILAVRLAKYQKLIANMQNMRSVRDMLENMWQAMLKRQVSASDGMFSVLANGVLIGLEMAEAQIEDEKPKPLIMLVQ